MDSQRIEHGEIFSGWKDVAGYLGKGVRTAQRYERDLKLPIRRPGGKSKGAVVALKADLDSWLINIPLLEGFGRPVPAIENRALLRGFTREMMQMRRVREETRRIREETRRIREQTVQVRKELTAGRDELGATMELLYKSLGLSFAEDQIQRSSSGRRALQAC
jgi:hypothetical protein